MSGSDGRWLRWDGDVSGSGRIAILIAIIKDSPMISTTACIELAIQILEGLKIPSLTLVSRKALA